MAADSTAPDRRTAQRVSALFAVELSSARKRGRFGVTRDASARGLAIVTPSQFEVGERLALAVYAAGGNAAHVEARVVRVDENPIGSPETWRFRLAVELDEALPSKVLDRAGDRPRALAS